MTLAPRVSRCVSGSLLAEKLRKVMIPRSPRRLLWKANNDANKASVVVLNKEIDCIERIMLREMSLVALHSLSSKLDAYFQEWHQTRRESVSCFKYDTVELNVLLNQIRLLSLDIIQRAAAWCATNRTMHNTAIHIDTMNNLDQEQCVIGLDYLGSNYLLKMKSDLDFLDGSPSV